MLDLVHVQVPKCSVGAAQRSGRAKLGMKLISEHTLALACRAVHGSRDASVVEAVVSRRLALRYPHVKH